jgi:peptidoglycan/LPS O-acetylase OafA/YrhL
VDIPKYLSFSRVEARQVSLPERMQFLTILRGVAALGVVLGHIVGMVPPDHKVGNFFQVPNYEKLVWPFLFGREMVWLFLFISGFSLYYSELKRRDAAINQSIGIYIKRRFIRILPTYYFGIFLGMLTVLVFSRQIVNPSPSLNTFRPISFGGLLSHLFFVQNFKFGWINQINPPLWSISIEIQLYLLLPVLLLRVRFYTIFTRGILLFCVIKLFSLFLPIPFFQYSEWFIVGVVTCDLAIKFNISNKLLNFIIFISGLVCFSRILIFHETYYRAFWMIFILTMVFQLQSLNPKIKSIFLSKLGSQSYSLYISHFPISLLVWSFVSHLSRNHSYLVILMLVCSAPCIWIVSNITYYFFESPSMKRLNNIK